MHNVTVEKKQLLETLKANREKHINTFEQVLSDYRDEAVRLLEEHIDRIRNGNVEKVSVTLPPPKNYETEYDKAIAMVEWSQDTLIDLEDHVFEQWVLDNWHWKHEFHQTNMLYSKS